MKMYILSLSCVSLNLSRAHVTVLSSIVCSYNIFFFYAEESNDYELHMADNNQSSCTCVHSRSGKLQI